MERLTLLSFMNWSIMIDFSFYDYTLIEIAIFPTILYFI